MTNTVDLYAGKLAAAFEKEVRFNAIFSKAANFRMDKYLRKGKTVDAPLDNSRVIDFYDYTANTDITATPYQSGKEQMTVNFEKGGRVLIDEAVEEPRSDAGSIIARNTAGIVESAVRTLDRRYMQEFDSSALTAEGSASSPKDLSSTNIDDLLLDSAAALRQLDPGQTPLVCVDPWLKAQIVKRFKAQGYVEADKALRTGGVRYSEASGVNFLMSNGLPVGDSITFTGAGTDGETFTIHGVTFTLKTTCVNGGDVKIGASASATAANLAAAIAGTGAGDGTDYQEWAGAESVHKRYKMLKKAGFATSVSGATITITAYGVFERSTTSSAASFGTQYLKTEITLPGATDMVIQYAPYADLRRESRNKGVNIIVVTTAAFKTFYDGAIRKKLLYIKTK